MRTRTSNLLIRSQVLYPIELWALELAARVASAGRAGRLPAPHGRDRARASRCPRQDSNLHAISGTGPSNQPVYQFQHVGGAR